MTVYFYHKFGWDGITFSIIDLDSSDKEFYHLYPGCCLKSFKLHNSLWPTNKILHQHKQAPSPIYPVETCTQKTTTMYSTASRLNL